MKELSLIANAKINLYLDITGRRADGYHLLETVMQSIDLCDIVNLSLCESGISVSCSDPNIPSGEGNICHKAARAFFEAAGRAQGVIIHIDKRIPSGAGLGGGSADAAAVLRGLNMLFDSALSEEELLRISAAVGADVPFCLCGGTRICKGIGELMERTAPIKDVCFLVVKPPYSCPTGEAYARYDSAGCEPKNALAEFLCAGADFSKKLYNVFEELYDDERTARIKQVLISAGAQGALLTGSGSAVFGVFGEEEAALRAAEQFAECFTAVCRPCGMGLHPLKNAGIIGIIDNVEGG